MTRFIWVRDREKVDHYINVNHIVRVTKKAAKNNYSAAAYIVLNEGHMSQKTIDLSIDNYDTAEDVIQKISAVMV